MTARVTQQVVTVAFDTDPKIRVSTVAIEVIRSISAGSLGATAKPVLFVITP